MIILLTTSGLPLLTSAGLVIIPGAASVVFAGDVYEGGVFE